VLQRAHTGPFVSFTSDSRRHRADAHVPTLIVCQAESTRCPLRLMHEHGASPERAASSPLTGVRESPFIGCHLTRKLEAPLCQRSTAL
jgi:hypothetical protein